MGAYLQFQPSLAESSAKDVLMNDNRIRVIYPELFPLECEFVNFSKNQIYSDGVPDEWPEGIEEINLSKNKISELDVIRWPSTLKRLNLSYNPLTRVPVGLPPSLVELDIRGTKIQEVTNVPDSVQNVYVYGCPVDLVQVPETCTLKGLFEPCSSVNKKQEHVRDIDAWGC